MDNNSLFDIMGDTAAKAAKFHQEAIEAEKQRAIRYIREGKYMSVLSALDSIARHEGAISEITAFFGK